MELQKRQRIALGTFFFMSGFAFSTWASRIPTIKAFFDLNEAQLGNLLLAMPVSSLVGLPISGWLVSKFDSRNPLIVAYFFFALGLVIIGSATEMIFLVTGICLFAFSMRILNISMNTQSLTLQKLFPRKILGSFHGLWSTGGLVGVLLSTLFIKLNISMQTHFLSVAGIAAVLGIMSYGFLLPKDRATAGNKLRLGKPDKFILYLGLLIFFASLCEGGMFDWSGVYFREVVKEELFTLGYLIFMTFMAVSRFFSDRLIERFGMPKMFIISSILISSGILLMILFPEFWPAITGFSLVGVGVAAIVPMIFSLAGTSKKYSAGMAISIITTYGIVGMLLGPPLVGYIAHLFNLKISFLLFLFAGLSFIPVSRLFFMLKEEQ
ncbi:MFS transporter [Salinimicrobium terrae]|uniref:MFS transporter n=1 Tax=Salinimicrobium terrae TaxID=470866 RepID=UPI0004916AD5|nr:MFS transporter [Salinimicrobium terrae]